MGDATKSNRRAVSLNDRHYRFLQDLSAPPKPSFNLTEEDEEVEGTEERLKEKVEVRRHLFKLESAGKTQDAHRNVPNFSGITDFDSSPQSAGESQDAHLNVPSFSGIIDFNSSPEEEEKVEGEEEQLKEKGEERQEQLKEKGEVRLDLFKPESAGETQDAHHNVPNFSGITDFNSSSEEEEEVEGEEEQLKEKVEARHHLFKPESAGETQDVHHNVPNFSGITDFDSSPEADKENKKLEKVKVEGRRRLCKLSSPDTKNPIVDVPSEAETKFADITDFDSPLPSIRQNNPGVGEIKDILSDLTSRLETLSIEKKRAPSCIDNVGIGISRFNRDGNAGKKLDMPEYESAESSFSHIYTSSDILSDACNDPQGGIMDVDESENEEEKEADCMFLSGSEYKVGGAKKVSVGKPDVEEESDVQYEFQEDTRVARVQKTPVVKKMETKEVKEKLRSVGRSVVCNRRDFEEDNSIDVYGTHAARAQKTLVVNKMETKKVKEKMRSVGRSAGCNRRDLDEDSSIDAHDCVNYSEAKKREPTKVSKLLESVRQRSVSPLRDDEGDKEWVEDEDNCVVLRGANSTFKLPSTVAKILYPHQREGLKWLWSLHCQGKGGILGDDMGLGKTMQVCGFLAGLFRSRLIKRALIVAPKTLLSHWIKELSVVGLYAMTREYFGTSTVARKYDLQHVLQDKGILLTTYDIVRNNSKSLQGWVYLDDEESEDGFTWDYMILDEGHLIKNPTTQRAKSLLEISTGHRIVISGTPIQNNLKELWALFNFCCPGLLGDHKQFKEKYEHPILRGNEKNASDRDKRIGSTAAKELREHIQPYFLRRLKNEVFKDDDSSAAKLSKKNEIIVWLRLTSCQRQLYEAFLQSELVLSAFDGSPLAALTILKKICDHPLLLTKRAAEDLLEGMDSMLNPGDAGVAERLAMHLADVAERTDFREEHDNVSCKLSFIMSLLDNLIPEGHTVLIFSQTRKMLNLIQESLSSNGYKFLRIDGTTKACDREKLVNDFQEGGAPIFLLTSQVGGLGLTLTKADRVIVVDPAWNPSTDNQSVDRAYRIGQKKDVLVYRLMTCGTVEEKIYRKQVYKGGLFKTATEHKEQTRYFSQQDLRELFSLPKQGFDVSLTQKQLHEEHDSQHKMNESLQAHLKFLDSLGIAGVSHHSLLFSKTAPVQVVPEEEKEIRSKVATFAGNSSSSYTRDRDVNGSQYAFNPKDVKTNQKSSPNSVVKLTESEIKDKINRLSQTLGNKVTVSRLPDKGAKLQKQIWELESELQKMRMENGTERKVIDVEDLTGDLSRVLNV